MSLRLAVWKAGAAALAILVLAGCDALPGRPRQTNRSALPSHITAFTELYGQFCAGCHGADGRLGAARPLNDPVYLALVPRDRLRQIIAQSVPGTMMPAFAASAGGALTEAQIDALVGEMLSRWGGPSGLSPPPDVPLPPYDGEAGDPQRGEEVYAAACAECHGSEGKGGPKGGPIADAAYLALVSDQALRTAVIAGRIDLGMPDWRGDIPGQPLTPQQIADVVAWLAAQRRPVMGRSASAPGAGADDTEGFDAQEVREDGDAARQR
jgi:cytochrome c oxidase cbb3-type subunit 3